MQDASETTVMPAVTRRMGVLFATSECAPFCKTGGLGDVAGTLPQQLAQAGVRVIVMLPKYGTIAQKYCDEMEHICDFYLDLAWRRVYCGLERIIQNGVEYYFVDNEDYFRRDALYGYFDDGERFAYFSKAITESLQYIPDFTCDILHCNDWQTALAPVFLREFYQGWPLYENVRTIFTVHNAQFQGQYSDFVLSDICGLSGIPNASRALYIDSEPKTINFMKGALIYSDLITTVSPTYAQELTTAFYGEGLDRFFRERSGALSGVVNGIDMKVMDPATDKSIAAQFSASDLSGKAACKEQLQIELGLEVDPSRPLVAMVTRLTKQKGMDLVLYGLEYILNRSVQVVILGTGDERYENALRYYEWRYPEWMSARIAFDPALSQRIYAGADLFLMPSIFEPCGIAQMISMRYGTLPIVRETGGLRDTVVPYNEFTGEGTGFSFANINGDEMVNCVMNACEVFWTNRDAWERLQRQAMAVDFSWKPAVDHYCALYEKLHPEVKIEVAKAAPAKKAAEEPKPPEPQEKPTEEKTAEEKAEPTVKPEPAAKEEPAAAPTEKPAEAPAKKTTTTRAAKKASTASSTATKKTASASSTATKKTTSRNTTTKKAPGTSSSSRGSRSARTPRKG